MSRKNFITFIVAAVGLVALVIAILLLVTPRTQYVRISQNQALSEMPEVLISDLEFQHMREARRSPIVQEALQVQPLPGETRNLELPIADAESMFQHIRPTGSSLGTFSVIEDTVYIDFLRGNDRIILECMADDTVRKTIARYENIENPLSPVAIYTSDNNGRFSKY